MEKSRANNEAISRGAGGGGGSVKFCQQRRHRARRSTIRTREATHRRRDQRPDRSPTKSTCDVNFLRNDTANDECVIVGDAAAGDTTRTMWKTSRRFPRWRTSNVDIVPSFLSCLVTPLVSPSPSLSPPFAISSALPSKVPPRVHDISFA